MPYETQPLFDVPSDSQRVWRYMGFSKLMWIIQEQKLHFHPAHKFDDKFEGTTPRAVKQIRDRSMSDFAEDTGMTISEAISLHENMAEKMRKGVFLNCWHANNNESAAMWDLYGSENKSIAIVSDVESLKKAFKDTEKQIYLSRLSYIDFYSDAEELGEESTERIKEVLSRHEGKSAFEKILFKRKEFEHENEIRAITSDIPGISEGGTVEPYFNISIDVPELINSIYISPGSPPWFSKTVEEYIEKCDQDICSSVVYPSKLDKEPVF